jgi:hypothetical protein
MRRLGHPELLTRDLPSADATYAADNDRLPEISGSL